MRYSEQTRAEVIAAARTMPIAHAARAHGVHPSTASRWVRDVRLGAGGPSIGVATAPRDLTRESHPIVGANVAMIHRALLSAFGGEPALLQDLYDDMLDRDDRVAAVCRTRVLALQAKDWSVEPPIGHKDDPEAKRIAERCEVILSRTQAGGDMGVGARTGGWGTVIGNIADAILRGYSVQEIEWALSAEGWRVPKRLHWRAQNRFVFAPRTMEIRKADDDDPREGVPLTEFGDNRFIIHSPVAGRPAYVTRRGVMLSMIFLSFMKRSGTRWWLKAIERWAAPIPYAEMKDGGRPSDELQAEVLAMLRELANETASFFWGGVDVKTLDGSGSLDVEAYDRIYDRANTGIAIVGLGQNLTTEVQGGSYAATKAQDMVRQDLLAGDAMELDSTVDGLLEMIVRYNWPGAPVPVYTTHVTPREPIPLHMLADFDEDERRASIGYGPREEPAASAQAVEPDPDPSPGGEEGGASQPGPFAPTPSPQRASSSPTRGPWTTGPARALLRL